MVSSLLYWCRQYDKLKYRSLCLDIETVKFNGPISVIGLYRPSQGLVEYQSFIRGKNLAFEELKPVFDNAKMLITYNGLCADIHLIKKEFPGLIPQGMVIIDLFFFCRKLDMFTNLKAMETTFGIERFGENTQKRFVATKLWRSYTERSNEAALKQLLDYNKEDTINLYPLAEKLVSMVYERTGQSR